jgi:outer membrane protein assembly factor BamB
MRRLRRIFKARGLLLGLVLALSLAGGALFQLNYVNADLAATPWPMFHHDLKHTGRSPYSGPASPWLKWSYTTGNSVGYTSPAIGSDGTIYVCSDDSKLYAINPNGSFKWSYTTGSASRTSPAIGSDGTIYVGATDNKLYAISDNGSFKWSYTTGTIYSSPAIGSDGTIYFGSENNKLNAVSDNGSFKWSYNAFGDSVESSPAIGSDGTIYVGSVDNKLYAISDNGSLKWSYTTGNYVNSSPAIGSDGTIYVGSRDSKLYAISDNGSFKWSCTTGNQIFSSPAIGSDGTIYVGSYFDNKLWAISDNSSLKWSYTTGGNVDSSPAIGGDGTIYVGSHDNKLYAINPNGGLKWSYTTGGYVGSPAIGSDGTIYFGSNDYKLYAIMQQPAPTVTSVSPNSGNQGQTLNNVIITGTYFTGATAVSFGAGITVNSFITDNATQIRANITIAGGAALGARDVSVTTPGGTGTKTGGFTVQQPTQTASVTTATGTGTATFTTNNGSITGLTAWAQSQLACRARPDLDFPQGFFSFNITNLTPGATVTITITLPSNMPKSTQYWKCINGQWVDCTSLLGSNDGDNIITLTITDGGLGDADGLANGTIVDPGGPAQQSTLVTPAAHRVSPTLQRPLNPAQMSVQYLSVAPQQASANQPVSISTNVVNTGDDAGNLNIALKINGQVEQTKTVSVGPQGTQPVKFTVTKTEPGTYAVDVGGQKGSFIVLGNGSTAHASVNAGLIVILLMGILILATVVVLLATRRHPA